VKSWEVDWAISVGMKKIWNNLVGDSVGWMNDIWRRLAEDSVSGKATILAEDWNKPSTHNRL
jgi:hypothetical protein